MLSPPGVVATIPGASLQPSGIPHFPTGDASPVAVSVGNLAGRHHVARTAGGTTRRFCGRFGFAAGFHAWRDCKPMTNIQVSSGVFTLVSSSAGAAGEDQERNSSITLQDDDGDRSSRAAGTVDDRPAAIPRYAVTVAAGWAPNGTAGRPG